MRMEKRSTWDGMSGSSGSKSRGASNVEGGGRWSQSRVVRRRIKDLA